MSNVAQVPQPRDNALVNFASRNFARFGLQNNIHCVPIDETEERNYDQVNAIFNELLGRAILPPRIRLNEQEEPWVLDCGFGKGAWIDTVLDHCDEAYVIGIDIFTGQGNGDDSGDDENGSDTTDFFVKKRWNLNAPFRESRDEQLRPNTFQLINSRFLTDGINANRWATYIRELHNLLEPGGWLQMVEVYMLFQSDSGRLDRDSSHLQRWWQYYAHCLERMGKAPRIAQNLEGMLNSAGFEQVHAKTVQMPIGSWMEGKERLGRESVELISEMLSSSSLWLFLRVAEPPLSPDQYQQLIRGAQQELRQPGLKLYLSVYLVYGWKAPRRR